MKRLLLILLVLAMGLTMTTAITAQDDMPALRIGVLPVLNTVPIDVALAEGFYEEQGVSVELVSFASAPDQQDALLAG